MSMTKSGSCIKNMKTWTQWPKKPSDWREIERHWGHTCQRSGWVYRHERKWLLREIRGSHDDEYEDGSSRLLWNIGRYLPDYTVPHATSWKATTVLFSRSLFCETIEVCAMDSW
jgi:hypothetical protein